MHLIIAPRETELKLDWESAMEYCENLVVNGHNDWRLPTSLELRFLVENYPTVFEQGEYWTSTERHYESPGAEFIDCINCNYYQSCWKTKPLLVRAVRRVKSPFNKQENE
jgi:hypothetical protein